MYFETEFPAFSMPRKASSSGISYVNTLLENMKTNKRKRTSKPLK
jgi:hypothetical protein